jgi:hypothetical protein
MQYIYICIYIYISLVEHCGLQFYHLTKPLFFLPSHKLPVTCSLERKNNFNKTIVNLISL